MLRFRVLIVASLICVLFVKSPGFSKLFSSETISSTSSVASVFLETHSVRCARAHVLLVSAFQRGVWTISRGIDLSLKTEEGKDLTDKTKFLQSWAPELCFFPVYVRLLRGFYVLFAVGLCVAQL